jgi:UDP-2-acetamido-3-amino-2,3-dideoxy-glucuronate N-acetyltransferase
VPAYSVARMDGAPSNDAPYRELDDVEFGEDVVIHAFTNLYGCRIGDRSRVGTFVEIQRGVEVGRDCKIQSHTFVCSGVRIGDGVFVGHGVMFVNDKSPRVLTPDGAPQSAADWTMQPVTIGDGASIGSGAVVIGPVTIGAGALVGAGAVVTRDVPARAVVTGVPARVRSVAADGGG